MKRGEDVEMIVGRALKPLLQRIVALERHSHPPVDLLPIIQDEVATAIRSLHREEE